MKLAHVHLISAGRSGPVARATVEADGRFAMATVRTGAFRLQFTGVDHTNAFVPLLVRGPGTIVVHVRLKHLTFTDALDSVAAIGDWNHFSFGSPKPLIRQPDGRYSVDVETAPETDSLAYELLGIDSTAKMGHSVNGTLADRYVYDEGGDYRSVIASHNGHATIVFDPTKLDRRPSELSVTFADPHSFEARAYALWRDWETERNHFGDSARTAFKRKERPNFGWAPFLARRATLLNTTREPLLRDLIEEQMLDAAAMGGKLDSLLARRILRELPPASPWWAYFEFGGPSRIMVAYRSAHPQPEAKPDSLTPPKPDTAAFRIALSYIDRAASESRDPGARAEALSQAVMLAQVLKDQVRANDYYNRLVTDYADAPSLAYLKAQFSPNRLWQPGHEVPAFHFASLDDTTQTYTESSLRGKFYLIDFWATWCGPCIGEMKYLQEAHDSLASRGLEILSISLDRTADDVRKFREGEWKMPWHHAYAASGFAAGLRDLEIVFVPRVILVGRDGKIIAVDAGLRGEDLVPTLRRALEAHASQ